MNKILRNGYSPEPQRFGDEGWSISIQGRKLSHMDYQRMYTHLWANTAQEYWAEKHKITILDTLSIDWDACGEAIKSLLFPKRRRIVKHACGHFGIGKKMLQWHSKITRNARFANNKRRQNTFFDARIHMLLTPGSSLLQNSRHGWKNITPIPM